ncbi:NAD(P)/FAD-dependent oxidoreductase [Nocardioides iriomotensis]|uniref:NAD(P)/FAD-dependent oxidoreductase n=1 Tax=Nocardioides iriomotensis TaxID=715784 RepID=A0A4Q5IWH1_9ACTN|nr:FAD-dependent oxidoreductase [Nocardioides iriomotensis]RYU09498.1 NAD(P)/FAD-dependent oxidoreductase [Nocardioides iriomotensis]
MSEPFVIVGGGLTAAKAVEQLRESGYDGGLVVYAAEQHLPYERPPLSKGYLMGDDERDSVFVHDAQWYADHDVDLRLGVRVGAIDPGSHTVTATGDPQGYSKLLLATGSQPRRLADADASGAPVAYLRTLEDTERLQKAFTDGARIAVLGAGWIGLEATSAARKAGAEVTVVESLDQPLLRVLGPAVASVFADLHREHGVDLRLGASVGRIEKNGDGVRLTLEDGGTVDADLLVVGIGAAPDTSLAEAAGLDVDNGVLVDASLRSSAPDVFAAGDIANADHPVLGRRVRVEHWDNAIEQGKAAARAMLGEDVSYDRLPYFFTDQYDLGMEYVGHVDPAAADDVVVRGDTSGERVFRAYWVKDGVVAAAMHANDWDAIDGIKEQVGKPLLDG